MFEGTCIQQVDRQCLLGWHLQVVDALNMGEHSVHARGQDPRERVAQA